EIENKIMDILRELPSESNRLDYKAKDYSNIKITDFIKDVIAFLNSDESYEENKYIILGITNDKYICGLKNTMRDDNEYQNLLNKINPRPDISTGSIDYNGRAIGYIFISGKNKDRVYEVNEDYKSTNNNFVCKGQAFIRKATVNYQITNKDRERIYHKKLMERNGNTNHLIQAITAKNELEKDKYLNKSEESTVEFKCKNNNGFFTVGN